MLTCTRVWDGQTIQTSDGAWLVLANVCAPPLDQFLGPEAKELLSYFVLNKPVTYQVVGTIRGASLATVWLPDDISVNQLMIRSGYGPHQEQSSG